MSQRITPQHSYLESDVVALPSPPKMRAFHLIPGVVLLLIGIGGPALELFDRQRHPIDVHTVTVTDAHRELVGGVGSSSSGSDRSPRFVRICDFTVPDGTTEDVKCPAAKRTGDEIKVYQGDNDVWKVYDPDWLWIVEGLAFTLLGVAYVWFWLWARAYHKRRKEERAATK